MSGKFPIKRPKGGFAVIRWTINKDSMQMNLQALKTIVPKCFERTSVLSD
ncbi:hypothetical protein OKW40_004199 [Paraburkholderia sp. RAU6.4a]